MGGDKNTGKYKARFYRTRANVAGAIPAEIYGLGPLIITLKHGIFNAPWRKFLFLELSAAFGDACEEGEEECKRIDKIFTVPENSFLVEFNGWWDKVGL